MTRYLVVAHQTARSRELADTLEAKQQADGDAEFVLLVPSTQFEFLLPTMADERNEIAGVAATRAAEDLSRAGINVVRAVVGEESPLDAIANELAAHEGEYDELIISTFPLGISRWLKLDIVHRAEDRFSLPVTHVVAKAHPEEKPTSLAEARDMIDEVRARTPPPT